MAMYVVYLGMGHTLLCKTIKAKTIRTYVSEAAKLIQRRHETYAKAHPQAGCPMREVRVRLFTSCRKREIAVGKLVSYFSFLKKGNDFTITNMIE
jgi:hypothetical protein